MPVSPVGNWSLISASGGKPEAASGLQRAELSSEGVPPEGQEATGTALMPAPESHFLPKAECEEVVAFTKGKVLLIQEINGVPFLNSFGMISSSKVCPVQSTEENELISTRLAIK